MDELLKKLHFGYDGLIRNINISGFNSAEIVISVKDHDLEKWINVRFVINSLEVFRLLKNRNATNVILSSGIQIKRISGLIYLNLDPRSDEFESLEDLEDSEVYFAGKTINYKIELYSEK